MNLFILFDLFVQEMYHDKIQVAQMPNAHHILHPTAIIKGDLLVNTCHHCYGVSLILHRNERDKECIAVVTCLWGSTNIQSFAAFALLATAAMNIVLTCTHTWEVTISRWRSRTYSRTQRQLITCPNSEYLTRGKHAWSMHICTALGPPHKTSHLSSLLKMI